MNTRQSMFEFDIGPQDMGGEGLGPTSADEDRAFRDLDEPRYIDDRPSTGIHCMDDNVCEPGVQLPGGLLVTRIASRYMTRRERPLKLSRAYGQEAANIVLIDP